MITSELRATFLLACAVAGCDAKSRLQTPSSSKPAPPVAVIGESPKRTQLFARTDCPQQGAWLDCTAVDAQGREYTFFEGALSRIAMNAAKVSPIELPAELEFGEPIEKARDKVLSRYQVKMEAVTSDGRTVYSTDFSIPSVKGVKYSLELISDEHGNLAEVVERTDF